MKNFGFILAFISFSSFAGSFYKTDIGRVEWTITSKAELNAEIYRNRMIFNMDNLEEIQRQRLTMIPSFGSLGKIGSLYTSSSEFHDERSADYVSKSIEERLNKEFDEYPLNYKVNSSHIELRELSCRTKGFIFKKTECSAQFVNKAEIELLD